MAIWHKYSSIAHIAILIAVVGHASSEFVAVLSKVTGPELSVWRFMLGSFGLILLTLLFPQQRNLLAPFKSEGLKLIGLAMLGVTIGYLLFHLSLDYATVPQVATIVTTIPIFVGLANLWVNKQPFTITKIIVAITAMIAVMLLITDGYLAKLSGESQNLIGILMAMGCSIVVAAYTVIVKPIILRYGALRITTVTMFIGTIGLWICVGLFWNIWVDPTSLFQRNSEQAFSLLTIGFWNTTITQLLWIGGLAAVPDITKGSYLFFLKPVIAAFLAVFFLNQHLTNWQFFAILIICFGVLFEFVKISKTENIKITN